MGSPAVYERNTTRGYAAIPNSLVENIGVLTHGELSLALVVLRRGGNGVGVSDRNWSAWTGLSPRLKEMSIKGLSSKGLTVEGRGEQARFTWEPDQWSRYVRSAPAAKPRTAGRSVDPKPGAKVHQDCRDKGCAMLRAECASGLSVVPATLNAQPVSQSGTADHPGTIIPASSTQTGLTVLPATQVAKPVSQTYWNLATTWAKTLTALKTCFPMIGLDFLAKLLAAVAILFKGVTDDELAKAVDVSFRWAGYKQKSPGLFLLTVPDALAMLRRKPTPQEPVPKIADYDPGAIDEMREVANSTTVPDWLRNKAVKALRALEGKA